MIIVDPDGQYGVDNTEEGDHEYKNKEFRTDGRGFDDRHCVVRCRVLYGRALLSNFMPRLPITSLFYLCKMGGALGLTWTHPLVIHQRKNRLVVKPSLSNDAEKEL